MQYKSKINSAPPLSPLGFFETDKSLFFSPSQQYKFPRHPRPFAPFLLFFFISAPFLSRFASFQISINRLPSFQNSHSNRSCIGSLSGFISVSGGGCWTPIRADRCDIELRILTRRVRVSEA